ncbi:hypothetical protein pb186bvf_008141 [Paramecium bursaria]
MQTLEDQIDQQIYSINWIYFQVFYTTYKQLMLVHSINQGYLIDAIHIILNDSSKKLIGKQIEQKIRHYKTLPNFKPAILVAKSNCLRFFLNCKLNDELKEDVKLGKLLALIIQYQEQIQSQIVQEQQKRSITPIKQKLKTNNNFKLISSQKSFHKKSQNSGHINLLEQKDKLLKQLEEQKIKEDEYNRYKIWFEQNQKLKKEKHLQELEERKSSREFYSRSISPNRILNMSLDERIKSLKNEIKEIETQNRKHL